MANLSKTVSVNIPLILKTHGAMNKNDIRSKYVDLEGCSSEFDFGQNKNGWSKLKAAIHTQAQKLVKQGVLIQPARGQFDVNPSFTGVATEFTSFLNGAQATVQAPTPVEAIEEPTDHVDDELATLVDVNNPAVIEARIDTENNELVQNLGGSRDIRTPLDEVEEGYIENSSIIETTSTLDIPENTEESSSVVETSSSLDLPESVEEDQKKSEFLSLDDFDEDEPEWDGSDNSVDGVYIEPNQKMKYDVKELIRTGSFDPSVLKLGSRKTNQVLEGSYLVYRDPENRNIVITQDNRDDYIVVPVDVDHSDLSDKYSEIASQAVNDFENAQNHKEGTIWLIKALVSCTFNCQHTDDFGGFVEYCGDHAVCPVKSIWSEMSYHVAP